MDADGLRLRPARPDDERKVTTLCERVYPGTDHIPCYWHEFLHDPRCLPKVLVAEDHVVGFAVLDLRPRATWLHSVRVDPRFRRQGMASLLVDHFLEETRARGIPAMRVATHPQNNGMLRTVQRRGFREVATYRYVEVAQDSGAGGRVSSFEIGPLSARDFERVGRFLRRTPAWKAGLRTWCRLWVWEDLDDATLEALLERKDIFGAAREGRLAGLAITCRSEEADDPWVFLSRIDGERPAVRDLAQFLKTYAGGLSVAKTSPGYVEDHAAIPLYGFVSDDPEVQEALLEAGFRRDEDEDLTVLEVEWP